MAREKKPGYDEIRHQLDSKMLQASGLKTEAEQRGFVNRSFQEIHKAYEGKQVSHGDYVKLINRLAAFQQGRFNDYMDMLAGAAQMGMLEIVVQGEVPQFEPEAAHKRRDAITGLTGVEPIQPDQDDQG